VTPRDAPRAYDPLARYARPRRSENSSRFDAHDDARGGGGGTQNEERSLHSCTLWQLSNGLLL